MKKHILIVVLGLLTAGAAQAKVDLVTLPDRDTVQLTIYNSADMTLVRDNRGLTLKNGINRLQFSWANTLIDPTSLEMIPKAEADKIDILDLSYPARTRNVGLWRIDSRFSGKVPVEITYLTSGISWRAFYLGTLATDEKVMRLQGYVMVSNNSGEDYENAQTRLIVGKVHILDQIAELARRQFPYGRPEGWIMPVHRSEEKEGRKRAMKMEMVCDSAMAPAAGAVFAKKDIVKEGLSEYFLYTIEGTETIPNGWSKRLPSFDTADVPVVNLYKYEAERYGKSVMRFLSFKNDEEHKLGETPIPGGGIQVFRNVNDKEDLAYEGASSFQYIPVNEDVELNMGAVENVMVDVKLMDYKTDDYRFNKDGNIEGWDEIREFEIEVNNTRDVPAEIEIKRNFPGAKWDLTRSGDFGEFEKVDFDTVKFKLVLEPRSSKAFRYVLTTMHGRNAD